MTAADPIPPPYRFRSKKVGVVRYLNEGFLQAAKFHSLAVTVLQAEERSLLVAGWSHIWMDWWMFGWMDGWQILGCHYELHLSLCFIKKKKLLNFPISSCGNLNTLSWSLLSILVNSTANKRVYFNWQDDRVHNRNWNQAFNNECANYVSLRDISLFLGKVGSDFFSWMPISIYSNP